uniref:Transmembrane protein 183A n=1 Tax=Cyanistes caeruleus TaxID=156563 RepID=A0A8C0VML3_CYACU
MGLVEVVGEGELHWAGQGCGSPEPGGLIVWSKNLLGTPGLHLPAKAHFPACASPPRASASLGTVLSRHRDLCPLPIIPNPSDPCFPCSAVTVADYANSDPAVVKSGRVKKAVANAVQQEVKSLCGLEASCVPAEEVLSVSGESCDSSDEMDIKESINGRAASRKKKSKRHKEDAEGGGGEEYPIDIWLLLASYIRPEDIVRFSLICKKAWTVTCTAAFWTRLYRRHYSLDAYLPLRLRPESMEKLHCLRACVIRSLFHMYEPFAARLSRNPAIPDSTPSTLKNSRASGELKSDTDGRSCVTCFPAGHPWSGVWVRWGGDAGVSMANVQRQCLFWDWAALVLGCEGFVCGVGR